MLRILVLFLLLANGLYFAWSHGYLAAWGWAPTAQTEPQRLGSQLKPEAMRLLSPQEAKRLEQQSTVAAAKPAECLQSGLLDDKAVLAVRAVALETLPAGTWALDDIQEAGRWIVYMGKYPSPEAADKKKAELRQLGVAFEPLQNKTLEPGISLAGFASQSEAQSALTVLAKRGVRTAKVAQEKAPASGQTLRLPVVDDALRPQLDGLKASLGPRGLRACTV